MSLVRRMMGSLLLILPSVVLAKFAITRDYIVSDGRNFSGYFRWKIEEPDEEKEAHVFIYQPKKHKQSTYQSLKGRSPLGQVLSSRFSEDKTEWENKVEFRKQPALVHHRDTDLLYHFIRNMEGNIVCPFDVGSELYIPEIFNVGLGGECRVINVLEKSRKCWSFAVDVKW